MVISLVTLGRFLFPQLPPQFVVCTHFHSLTGWRQLLQEKVPQVMEKPDYPLSHQLVPKIIQVEQKILGMDVLLLR